MQKPSERHNLTSDNSSWPL